MAKKYKILYYPEYLIDVDGKIYDENENEVETFLEDFVKYAYLGDVKVDIARLMMNIFTAPIDLPIIFKDGDITNCASRNLTYHVNSEDIESNLDDEDSFKIKGILFKRLSPCGKYFISSNGLIYDMNRHDFTKIFLDKDLYKRVGLNSWSLSGNYNVNRLVYEIHIGQIKDDNVVHHKDAFIWNNDINNLKQCNISHNVSQEYMMGNRPLRCGLSIDQIEDVCKMMSEGYMTYKIMEKYNIPKEEKVNFDSMCSSIRRGIIYTDFDYDYTKFYINAEYEKYKLNEDKVRYICEAMKNKESLFDIAMYVYEYDSRSSIFDKKRRLKKVLNNMKKKGVFSYVTKDYNLNKWKI